MITDLKKINVLYLAIIICSISSYLVYVIFPVTFNKPIPGNTLFDKILLYNYAIDFHPTVNNLPSLHVAFTWIIYFAYKSQKPRRINNIIFCLLVISISVSTLFVKQHLIVDLICGFIWAILSWKVAKRICKSEHFNELSPILVFKRVNKKVLPLMILSSILILSIMIIKIF